MFQNASPTEEKKVIFTYYGCNFPYALDLKKDCLFLSSQEIYYLYQLWLKVELRSLLIKEIAWCLKTNIVLPLAGA